MSGMFSHYLAVLKRSNGLTELKTVRKLSSFMKYNSTLKAIIHVIRM